MNYFYYISIYSEQIEPIGEGPEYNPDGHADVSTNLHDSSVNYQITAKDYARSKKRDREEYEEEYE